MTVQEFQLNHSGELKTFVESPVGREFMQVLGSARPNYEYPPHDHLLAENRGAMRGYELCLRNILGLCMPPPKNEQIKPTYGVPETKA